MHGSVFLRIPYAAAGDVRGWAIEVNREGYIVRELEFDASGDVVAVVGEEEYGYWNDSMGNREAPGSDGFDQFVRTIGAKLVSAEEFEAMWRAATEGS